MNLTEKINKTLETFLNKSNSSKFSPNDSMGKEECDPYTGECHVIRSKDGIIERINKKFITEDGRQLLQD
jgi:hypothetical protein